LQAEHGIKLSYTWVKQALQGAGLVARGRKRGAHRKRRERRPLPGMLLHILPSVKTSSRSHIGSIAHLDAMPSPSFSFLVAVKSVID
jgi:hypothetical protein